MSQQGEIVFLPSQQQQPQFTQQPQQTFVQQPVRLGQSNGQRGATSIVGRQRTPSSVSRGTIICLVIVIILAVVGAIVLAFFLQGITNADKSGCTEAHYDNFQRGFGIDDGSCFFNQRKKDKTVKTCPITRSFYYDVGGIDANYTPLEWENVIINATTSFVLNSKDLDDDLCFTINAFDVDGGALCAAASLEISGTTNDGVYCNTNVPPTGTRVCVDSLGKIDFTWYSDGKTNATGWEIEFVCGTFGCTIPQASNFNPEASIDDGSCIILPLSSGGNNIIEFCDDIPLFFYDSGGPDGDYQSNETSITQFKSSDPSRLLRLTYEEFNVTSQLSNTGCQRAVFLILYNEIANDFWFERCNEQNNPALLEGHTIDEGEKIVKIFFSSTDQSVASGWKIKIECLPPV